MKGITITTQFAFAVRRVVGLVLAAVIFLAGCAWHEEASTNLMIGFTSDDNLSSARVVSRSTLSREPISSAYPSLGTILLAVSSANFSPSQINDDYNDGSFTMNDDNTAFVLSDTVVDLNVPNTATLTIAITAFNKDGFQVYTGQATLSPSQLSAPALAVAVPIVFDVDDRIPILSSVSDCLDDDSDGYCSVYEDLFVNAQGLPDIDGDGDDNSVDIDSDGDDRLDRDDHNPAIGKPTSSNNGYPMFIVKNRAPVAEAVSRTTSQNTAVEISIPASSIDVDVNDAITFTEQSAPSNGTVAFNNEVGEITYTPNSSFVGVDSFTVTATDLAGDSDDFIVTVTVIDDPAIDDFVLGDRRSTPGAAIPLNVLSEGQGQLTVVNAITTAGELYIPTDGSNIYFRTDSDEPAQLVTVTYQLDDETTNTITISLHEDLDGDGLSPTVITNYASALDAVDTDISANGDVEGLNDYLEEFVGQTPVAGFVGTDALEFTIDGVLATDTVWDISGSPYIVNGPLTIEAELIIEQGVEVKIGIGGSIAVGQGPSGKLVVWGGDSEVLAVRFTSTDDDSRQRYEFSDAQFLGPGSWVGLIFNNQQASILANARIIYSDVGLSIDGGDSPIIDNTHIINSSSIGLLINTTGVPVVTDSVFAANTQGISIFSAGDGFEITNSIIRDNKGGDIEMNSGAGVYFSFPDQGSSSFSVTNSLIVNNQSAGDGAGVYISTTEIVNLFGNTFDYNTSEAGSSAVYIDGSLGSVTAVNNIFSGNECGDGCFTDIVGTGAPNSASIYNLSDSSGANTGLLDSPENNLGVAAFYTSNWYQSQSPSNVAINRGSASASSVEYLSRLSKPTTSTDGSLDVEDVDAGYHYDSALVSIDPARTIGPSLLTITNGSEIGNSEPIFEQVTLILFDSNGRPIGADQFIYTVSSVPSAEYTLPYLLNYVGNGQYSAQVQIENCSTVVTPVTTSVDIYVDDSSVAGPIVSFTIDVQECPQVGG